MILQGFEDDCKLELPRYGNFHIWYQVISQYML